MKETLKLVVVLTVICLLAGTLLAFVSKLTKDPIERSAKSEKTDAITKVLPPCDNSPDETSVDVDTDAGTTTFYVATKDGGYVGAAFEVSSDKGYGGKISLMVGVGNDGTVYAIEVLKQMETPGLGAKITSDEFKGQFAGRSIADTKWAVKKDGGDIDEITAATISSRAVTEAIRTGLDVYSANKKRIRAGASGKE